MRPPTPATPRPTPWYTHLRASALVLVLILATGCIAFPLAVVGFADLFAPSTAAGQPFAGQNQTNSTAVNNSPPPVATVHVLPAVRPASVGIVVASRTVAPGSPGSGEV